MGAGAWRQFSLTVSPCAYLDGLSLLSKGGLSLSALSQALCADL